MRRKAYLPLLCCLLATFPGCRESSTTQTSGETQTTVSSQANVQTPAGDEAARPAPGVAAARPKFDACSLLTKEEIQSVQGEPVKETKTDGRTEGGMSVSQCFYSVATFSKSVSLAVTQSDPDNPGRRGPREFWNETFDRENEKEREREKEKERDRDKGRDRDKRDEKEREQPRGREEEEEEGTPPKKVPGVGDDAYWMGSRVGGALYVLKKNAFIRISVGGPDSADDKLNKSKALAQKAIKRL